MFIGRNKKHLLPILLVSLSKFRTTKWRWILLIQFFLQSKMMYQESEKGYFKENNVKTMSEGAIGWDTKKLKYIHHI